MTIHASERWVNVKASIFTWVLALPLTGAPPWVVEGQARAQAHDGPWARLTLTPVQEVGSGMWSSTARAMRQDLIIVADLWWPDGSVDLTQDAYALDRAADDLVSALRYADIPLLDYVSDPDSPTDLTGHAIRILEPQRAARAAADGFQRVQITADAYLHIQQDL